MFRASFVGTALSGGGRARKKPEKHRGPCGESGARDRLRARGITGIRRPRLVVIGLSLEFALSALRPAERGKSGPTLTTRTYSYPNQPLHVTACHAPELRILCCGQEGCCWAARTYSDLLEPALSERGLRISADGRSHQWAFKSRPKKLERFRQAAPLLQNLDGFLHLSLFCLIRNLDVNKPSPEEVERRRWR